MPRSGVGKSASRVLAAQIVTTALTLISTVLVARTMGLVGTGVLTVMFATSWILSVFFEFGLGTAAPYGVGRLGLLPSMLKALFLVVALLLFLIAAALCASPLMPWAAETLGLVDGLVAQSVVITGAGLASANMCRQLLMTCKCERAVAWLWPVDRVVLAGVLLLAPRGTMSPNGLPFIFLVSGMVTFLAHWLTVLALVRGPFVLPVRATAAILRNSASVYISGVMQVLNYRLDTLLVSAYAGASAAGLYGVAVSLGNLLWYVPNAVSFAWLPRVSGLDAEEAGQRTADVTRHTFRVVAVSAAVLAVTAQPIIKLLWGASFVSAASALVALLPGVVLFSAPKVLTVDFIGRGRSRTITEAAALSLGLTIALNLLLIPRVGYMGAAVTSSVAYGVFAIYCLARYQQLTGITAVNLLLRGNRPRRSQEAADGQ